MSVGADDTEGATHAQDAGFTVYPAIDVRDGRVVRLRQGDYDRETRYRPSPLDTAREYRAEGATWLHLVDLDAARAGGYTLAPLLRRVIEQTGLRVQTGGGVRTVDEVTAILDAGASRVVVGSVAVGDPDRVIGWLDRFGPDRLTVALDTRAVSDGRWTLPVSGWTTDSETDLTTLLHRYADAGLKHLLCTDIGRDGMLGGPNMHLYTMITRSAPGIAVQASGGVRHVADVRSCRKAGCAGAVLGKALLEGRLALPEAIDLQQPGRKGHH